MSASLVGSEMCIRDRSMLLCAPLHAGRRRKSAPTSTSTVHAALSTTKATRTFSELSWQTRPACLSK
eukprot:903356-Alexandrium_andersonii.AAC.1